MSQELACVHSVNTDDTQKFFSPFWVAPWSQGTNFHKTCSGPLVRSSKIDYWRRKPDARIASDHVSELHVDYEVNQKQELP